MIVLAGLSLKQSFLRSAFNSSLSSLIKFSTLFASLSALWNRERLECFTLSRGLRQRDPLSPYLFIFFMESLSLSITQSVSGKSWHPFKAPRNSLGNSHLFFADDLLLFGEASFSQA